MKPCDSGSVQEATDAPCVWSGCLPACACLTQPPAPVSVAVNHSSVHRGRRKRSDVKQRVAWWTSSHSPSFRQAACEDEQYLGGGTGFTSLSPPPKMLGDYPHTLHLRNPGPTNLHSGELLVHGFSITLSKFPLSTGGHVWGCLLRQRRDSGRAPSREMRVVLLPHSKAM